MITTTNVAFALTAGVVAFIPTPDSGAGTDPEPVAVEYMTPPSSFTDSVSIGFSVALDGEPASRLDIPDPSHVVTAELTFQAGAGLPWHLHAGPVLITVAEGEVVYVDGADCVERHYPAGTSFIDPGGGSVHAVYNVGDGVSRAVATFFKASAGGPLTTTEGVATPSCDGGAWSGEGSATTDCFVPRRSPSAGDVAACTA